MDLVSPRDFQFLLLPRTFSLLLFVLFELRVLEIGERLAQPVRKAHLAHETLVLQVLLLLLPLLLLLFFPGSFFGGLLADPTLVVSHSFLSLLNLLFLVLNEFFLDLSFNLHQELVLQLLFDQFSHLPVIVVHAVVRSSR